MDLTRPVIDILGDLTCIGIEYVNGRMTRNAYVEAAVALGLTPVEAHKRAVTWDLAALHAKKHRHCT
jgi:hypothetical protein